ncbi:MAG: ATPase domain-containing protein [Candidatus Firestonebacteria bacterium]
MKNGAKRIKTGIKGFDEMLGGGLYEGSSMLLKGAPGTGKTTLGLQFIYNGITKFDEGCIIITFEEFPQKLYRDALSLGWDLKALEEKNKLKVIFTSPEIFMKDLKSGAFITKLISEMNVRRVLIDTVSYFQGLSKEAFELRKIFTKVIYSLEKENITSIFVEESVDNGFDAINLTYDFSYVVDVVVSLRFVEVEGSIKKAILVLKTRGSEHDGKIREFTINFKGIDIKNKFDSVEGILSGNTRKIISDRLENFFVKKLK